VGLLFCTLLTLVGLTPQRNRKTSQNIELPVCSSPKKAHAQWGFGRHSGNNYAAYSVTIKRKIPTESALFIDVFNGINGKTIPQRHSRMYGRTDGQKMVKQYVSPDMG
jgi:hypothetical protein